MPKTALKFYFSVTKKDFIIRISSHFSLFYPRFAMSALSCQQKMEGIVEMRDVRDTKYGMSVTRNAWFYVTEVRKIVRFCCFEGLP